MKLWEFIIKPMSAFGTPLKGDTLFGQFCWQALMEPDILTKGLAQSLSSYHEKPFAVFSSAYPILQNGGTKRYYALSTPSLPLHFYETLDGYSFSVLASIKDRKKKRWMLIESDALQVNLRKAEFLSDRELFDRLENNVFYDGAKKPLLKVNQPHNTISRITFRTGKDFSPYIMENLWYTPAMELAIFVLFDEEFLNSNSLLKGIESMGKIGYGRDASTGLGKFLIVGKRELKMPDFDNFNMFYTLSPLVPEKNATESIWYRPFVRFGKHGNFLANARNPFKNPIFMADEGAVVELKEGKKLDVPYMGRGLKNLSKALPETVSQGYSIVIPCKVR